MKAGKGKQMFLYSSEYIIYEGDEWALISDHQNRVDNTRLYGTHSKCTEEYKIGNRLKEKQHHYGEYCWLVLENEDPKCRWCGETVPDDIQAMVVLYRAGKGEL